MKNSAKHAKKAVALLRKLSPGRPKKEPDAADHIGVLVYSFLLWESTSSKATAAYSRLQSTLEDYNELRVSMPDEIVEICADTSPMGTERAKRICASLRSIYLREHDVNLEAPSQLNKTDLRHYIESLDGMVPFVSARVLMRCFGIHAIPVDEHLRMLLVESDVIDEGADVQEAANWLARQIKSDAGEQAHECFQALVDTEYRRVGQVNQRREKAEEKERELRIKERQKERQASAKTRRAEREEAARKRAAKAASAEAKREKAAARKKAPVKKKASAPAKKKAPVKKKASAKKKAPARKKSGKSATRKKAAAKKKAGKKAAKKATRKKSRRK